jgi:hypothetical protein
LSSRLGARVGEHSPDEEPAQNADGNGNEQAKGAIWWLGHDAVDPSDRREKQGVREADAHSPKDEMGKQKRSGV